VNGGGGIANRLGNANDVSGNRNGSAKHNGFQRKQPGHFNKGQRKQGEKQDEKSGLPSAEELDSEMDLFNRNKVRKNVQKKSVPAAVDLDSELDSYMEQHPNNS